MTECVECGRPLGDERGERTPSRWRDDVCIPCGLELVMSQTKTAERKIQNKRIDRF